MRLFNTLSQETEPLAPVNNAVTLYVCGITPYDTTHLGHAFINVIYDTLVRYLRWRGLSVTYVQNVTDIDDDILRKSRELGMTWDGLGRRETDRYLSDLRAINVAIPDHYVYASQETAKMIELIEALLAKDLAYIRDGWVYFAVKRDPDFGKLADAAGYVGYQNWLKTANERGNFPDDPRKIDPLDFVLWQGQQPGEPAWPSPWGPGRPGWHIECSAMAVKYLGPRVDIHGGGADLMFPHHTCEIAQSENATDVRPFVRIWMHCAMVELDGEKMSKSLGNLILVRNLLPDYSPDAIRVMLLSHHYRDAWEYTDADMRAAAALAARLKDAATLSASLPVEDESPTPLSVEEGPGERVDPSQQACLELLAALEDDFHTERALAALDRLAASAHASGSPAQSVMLRNLASVLGLTL
ncbi:MAG: Cysteinyl-tRNA synthetase [Ktedonobacterales bacterium]|jgi:L-cysteine:1D-myo-inositol 2-amino-2-deoxy-alpha-D-glucopyranoside ligase|nr:MAG: Cysteinyl-tRNA synthetase [Ktedonobacterales bacterium]